MSFSAVSKAICFIVCHAGPADHFFTFAEHLESEGYTVNIYAAGPALKKGEDQNRGNVFPFSLDKREYEDVAADLAKKCAGADLIMTDVGHPFDVTLQNVLEAECPKSVRLAYYDNPEAYVPGGYSSVAAKVMKAAEGVLFANSNLSKSPLYETRSKIVDLPAEKKMGLGYYPTAQAEKIKKRKVSDLHRIRADFFSKYSLQDRGETVLVYVGGNNEEYFSKAFPAFLQFLTEASLQQDLSDFIFLFQQHPGAKEKNLDGQLIQEWVEQNRHSEKKARLFLSQSTSDEAQVLADGILYYQTSLGPQFILAGIPTIQVAHSPYEDILVKHQLCLPVADSEHLMIALARLKEGRFTESGKEALVEALGIQSDWAKRLEYAMNGLISEKQFRETDCPLFDPLSE